MLAKPKAPVFIDNLTIEVEDARYPEIQVLLRSEDGKICCKTEKKINQSKDSFCWEGLNDLPYGIYTLECTQGEDTISVRMVKRI
ncbi:MAG: hypothetical protein ACK4YD_09420 [Chitinophagia bacterium]|jgi:hypothetical protein